MRINIETLKRIIRIHRGISLLFFKLLKVFRFELEGGLEWQKKILTIKCIYLRIKS